MKRVRKRKQIDENIVSKENNGTKLNKTPVPVECVSHRILRARNDGNVNNKHIKPAKATKQVDPLVKIKKISSKTRAKERCSSPIAPLMSSTPLKVMTSTPIKVTTSTPICTPSHVVPLLFDISSKDFGNMDEMSPIKDQCSTSQPDDSNFGYKLFCEVPLTLPKREDKDERETVLKPKKTYLQRPKLNLIKTKPAKKAVKNDIFEKWAIELNSHFEDIEHSDLVIE